jgi:hypothetical protein
MGRPYAFLPLARLAGASPGWWTAPGVATALAAELFAVARPAASGGDPPPHPSGPPPPPRGARRANRRLALVTDAR